MLAFMKIKIFPKVKASLNRTEQDTTENKK